MKLPRFSSNKILFILSILLVAAPLYLYKVRAEDPQLFKNIKTAQDIGENAESWVFQGTGSVSVALITAGLGDASVNQMINPLAYKNNPQPIGGIMGANNSLIASTYGQPISGVEYIAMVKDSMLGRPALAQGAGFQGLRPLLPVWRTFRNIIYILASLFFIAVGVMVILRVKISPQAVVTVQSAIPQIITTLLLVTFSYAIAGLLIDFMTLIQGIVLAALFTASGTSLTANLLAPNITGNTFTFSNLANGGFSNIYDLSYGLVTKGVWASWSSMLQTMLGAIVTGGANLQQGLSAGGTLASIVAVPLMGIGSILYILIMSVLIIFFQLKFLFGLIKCYVSIIFKIVIAPLEIGIGALPGVKMGFSSWLNDLFANLMVFPISILFLVIANFIIEKAGPNIWAPNIIDATNLVSSFNLAVFFIGFGALMLVSQLPTLIPQLVFQIKPSGWDTAIGKGTSEFRSRFDAPIGIARGTAGEWIRSGIKGDAPQGGKLGRVNAWLGGVGQRVEDNFGQTARESFGTSLGDTAKGGKRK